MMRESLIPSFELSHASFSSRQNSDPVRHTPTHTREYDKSDGSDGGEGKTSHDSGGEDWWAVVMASVMHSRVRRLKE